MKQLMEWIVKRPATACALLFAGMIASGAGLIHLKIDPSVDGLIIDDEDKAYHEEIKTVFGDDTVLMIYMKSDQIFTEAGLTAVENLTYALEDITIDINGESFSPISSTRSLTTVTRIEGEIFEGEEEYYLNTNKLVDWIPSEPEELAAIRTMALGSELFVDDIISKDGTVTAINGFVTAAPDGAVAYDMAVVDAVQILIDQEQATLKEAGIQSEMFVVGVPVSKVELGRYIQGDMMMLVPISLLMIFLILAAFYRTPVAMILPMITGNLSVIAAVGIMGWMGYAINLISNIVPLLLLVIGCTEDIHLLSDYAHELRHGQKKREAVRRMAIKSGLAIFLTSLTTVLGFTSLATNSIVMLREFGIAAAIGLTVNFIVTIVVVPTVLNIFPVPKRFLVEEKKALWSVKVADMLCVVVRDYRHHVLAGVVAVLLLAGFGASKVVVNNDLMSYFQPDAPIRVNMDRLADDLSGGQNFTIVIDTGREDGVKDPAVMRAMIQLQEEMEAGPFDKAVSVANYIRTTHREMNGDDPAFNLIPDEGIAEYLLLLEGDDMDRMLESTYERAIIAVRHEIHGSWKLKKELTQVRERARELLPKYVDFKITGKGILFNKASDSMAVGQVESLSMAMGFIFIVIAILFVSIKAGLLAMIPNIVPILTIFGIMGFTGIPLSPGTCTVAVIALGIAVDDTIHLMVCYHQNLKNTTDQLKAMEAAIHEQFLPVLSSSIALGLGFSVLMGSQITSSQDFGLLASIAMIIALISDIVFTPAVLLSTQLISSWDLLTVRINEAVLEKSPLFAGFTKAELKRVAVLGVLETYQPDQAIVSKGEESDEMYLILDGQAQVKLGKGGTAQLEPGAIFGEMAFVTGEARTADVIASGEVQVLKIDTSVLARIRKRFPNEGCKLFLNISQILSRKLGETNRNWLAQPGS